MFIITFFSSLFIACNETVKKTTPDDDTPSPECFSIDNIVNTSWIYDKGDNNTDSKFRLNFYSQDGKTRAHYNAGDMRAMYDYDCVLSPSLKKVLCSTAPEPVDLCLSFFAAGKKCTRSALQKFYDKRLGIKGIDKKQTHLTIDPNKMREANIKAEEKIVEWKKQALGKPLQASIQFHPQASNGTSVRRSQ